MIHKILITYQHKNYQKQNTKKETNSHKSTHERFSVHFTTSHNPHSIRRQLQIIDQPRQNLKLLEHELSMSAQILTIPDTSADTIHSPFRLMVGDDRNHVRVWNFHLRELGLRIGGNFSLIKNFLHLWWQRIIVAKSRIWKLSSVSAKKREFLSFGTVFFFSFQFWDVK